MVNKKLRVLTAIKPTGLLTLGNYIGMLKNFKKFQNDNECFIFIANLHALTTPIKPEVLKSNCKDIVAFYLACGLDPNKCVLFLQSDVCEHSELNSILQNFLYIGELKRMTQFKNQVELKKRNMIGLGIFTYPVLMCADILLYNADIVPVGDDQKQHVELTRNLAKRFNSCYDKKIFTIPQFSINKVGNRIMNLLDPTKKMCKSKPNGVIFLKDDLAVVRKKILSAVTDSDCCIKYDVKKKPGVSNLLVIYAALKNMSIKKCEEYFKNSNYANFKKEIADVVVNELQTLQSNYKKFLNNDIINKVLKQGAEKAHKIASENLKKIKKIVGLSIY